MPNKNAELDFQNIYQENYPRVVRYLRQLVGAAEAEDLAQEVFLKVNRSLDGFRGESQLTTWIYRIARNTALDRLRCVTSKPVYFQADSRTENSDGLYDESEEVADDDRRTPAAILARKEMGECIRGMVNSLPEKYRSVLILTEFEGLSAAEAAVTLGITLETVKIRLHRARTYLRNDMNECCNFSRDDRNEMVCQPKDLLT